MIRSPVELKNFPRSFGSSLICLKCAHYLAITDYKRFYTDFISKDVDATVKDAVCTLVNGI
ncbi:UNVERIFIED_CONTAM: hypothetical protein NCL1_21507 [Trichonephila clavipes]